MTGRVASHDGTEPRLDSSSSSTTFKLHDRTSVKTLRNPVFNSVSWYDWRSSYLRRGFPSQTELMITLPHQRWMVMKHWMFQEGRTVPSLCWTCSPIAPQRCLTSKRGVAYFSQDNRLWLSQQIWSSNSIPMLGLFVLSSYRIDDITCLKS